MSAGCGRAMKPGGWIPRGTLRTSMDGVRLLAARLLCGLLTAKVPSCPPRVVICKGGGGDPVRPEVKGRQPEGTWKTTARGGAVPSRLWLHGRIRRAAKVRLRRNGKSIQAPGEARPPRALPNRPATGGAEACVAGWGELGETSTSAFVAEPPSRLGLPPSGGSENPRNRPVFDNLVPRNQPPHPERMPHGPGLLARRNTTAHIEIGPHRSADGRAGVQRHHQTLIAAARAA